MITRRKFLAALAASGAAVPNESASPADRAQPLAPVP